MNARGSVATQSVERATPVDIYKGLRILSRYCSCQDSEFRSALETSSVDIDKLLSKNFFLWIQCRTVPIVPTHPS